MSRDDGFSVADIDSAYFDDAKMRDLWQRLRDPALMATAVCLHQSTVLASWRHGERVTAAQAAPLWIIADQGMLDMLHAVGLLDGEYRVPEQSWTEWFGAAYARRDLRRAAGRTGGLAASRGRSTDATPMLDGSSTDAVPVRPSVRTDRPPVVPREGLPNLNATVAAIWEEATGRSVLSSGQFAIDYLDDACRRFPAYEVGAAIKRGRMTFDHIPAAQPLIVAVRAILDPLPNPKEAASGEATAEEAKRRQRAIEATLSGNHAIGGHMAEPHSRCPTCKAVAS